LETYNLINTYRRGACDLFFHEITSVQIVNTNAFFSTEAISSAFELFTYQFRVEGSCLGCANDTDIFDADVVMDGIVSRQLDIVVDTRRILQQGIGNTNSSTIDECVCEVDPLNNQENRGPSREEFETAFNHSVTLLVKSGELSHLEEVVDVAEVEPTPCSVAINNFLDHPRISIHRQGLHWKIPSCLSTILLWNSSVTICFALYCKSRLWMCEMSMGICSISQTAQSQKQHQQTVGIRLVLHSLVQKEPGNDALIDSVHGA